MNTRMKFLVRASFLQIYNEVISDLLKPERTNLTIREDKRKGVFVEVHTLSSLFRIAMYFSHSVTFFVLACHVLFPGLAHPFISPVLTLFCYLPLQGLSEWVVRSPQEIYGLMQRGAAVRATGSTRMNETSSRSHAVFVVIVEQSETVQDEEECTSNPLN